MEIQQDLDKIDLDDQQQKHVGFVTEIDEREIVEY